MEAAKVTKMKPAYRAYPYPGVGLTALVSVLAGAVRYCSMKAGFWHPAAATRSG